MQRKIIVEIETDESGRYCDSLNCIGFNYGSCNLFYQELNGDSKYFRCDACISAEEICKPLSEYEIAKVMDQCAEKFNKAELLFGNDFLRVAEAIHRAMTNKGDTK